MSDQPEEIYNAKIIKTMLGYEDHGILSFYLTVNGSFGECSFGGWNMGSEDAHVDDQSGFGSVLLGRVLKCLDVPEWEALRGTSCRIKIKGRRCVDIGHFIEDNWVGPVEVAKRFYPDAITG